jgi:DHA1 family multidrug resistance protein-like MFS transporter
MYHWRRTLAVTAVAQTFSLLGFSFVLPFLPIYVQQFGVHGVAQVTLWAALLSSSASVTMALVSPVWGSLADRFGRKIMVVRSAFSAALLIGLMGAATSLYQLFALSVLQGAFTGTMSAAQALVASQVPRERLGFSLGVMQTAIFTGASAGPVLGGLIVLLIGFRPSYAVAAFFLVICGTLVTFFVHEERNAAEVRSERRDGMFAGIKRALSLPGLLPSIASLFVVQFAVTQVFPILPQFVQSLQGPNGHAVVATGLILGGAGLAGALASTAIGWVSDRTGYKRVLVVSAVVACVLSVAQYFVTTTLQLGILRVMDGCALGGMMPAAAAILGSVVPRQQRGAAYGLAASMTSLGFAAGPLTSAAVVAVGGIRDVFLTAAVLLGLIAIWVEVMVHVPAAASRAAGDSTITSRSASG